MSICLATQENLIKKNLLSNRIRTKISLQQEQLSEPVYFYRSATKSFIIRASSILSSKHDLSFKFFSKRMFA